MAQLTGENFNIFKILSLQTAEVRAHSAFLAELLNPCGAHGQGDLFLSLFVEQLGVQGFDTRTAFAEVEKYTGIINADYTKGGKIDILITDGTGKHIIIENKINAQDQKNQLLRYYNFDPRGQLYYLTLFGNSPALTSTDGQLSVDKYKLISYSNDILDWLEKCKKEAALLPTVRESIVQYINLLRSLTDQTSTEKMKEEIKALLSQNPDYVDAYTTCEQAVNELLSDAKKKFVETFNRKFSSVDISLQEDSCIQVMWGEDSDGVHFGYRYQEIGKSTGNPEQPSYYTDLLKQIESNNQMYSSVWLCGWFNPKPFSRYGKFEHLDRKERIKMATDSTYLEEFIDRLIAQEREVTEELRKRIKLAAELQQ
nr:PD-(D/E)XK nuclease family protein [Pontibacter sp. HSC-36F09]